MTCFKNLSISVLLTGFLGFWSFGGFSQACFNSDFENGTIDGYVPFIGSIANDGTITIDNQVLSPEQHRVFFLLDGVDPIAEEFCTENEFLPVVPQGGGAYAMRLGNSQNGARAERVTISFTVTEENNFFLLNYAVLLNDPNHLPHEQPRFRLSITDSEGEQYPCGYYEVVAAANIENFENCGGNWKVRPWTAIGIELQSYLGERINIEMSTNDCSRGGHAGYAYLDANCKPLDIELFNSCDSSSVATMFVTAGFDKYEWSTGDSTSRIEIANPVVGDEYFVTVTSATGCSIVLSDTIPSITQELEPVFSPSTVTTICSEAAFNFRPDGTNLTQVYSVELDRFIDSIVINNVTQNTYTFIAFTRAGCPTDTVTHYFNGLPYVIDSIGETLCSGTDEGSISLRPLISGSTYTYMWSTGDTTSTITDLRAGTYVVTISDENCDFVADYQVEQPDPISIGVEQDRVICRGYGAEATFYVRGGTSPYLYSYDGGNAYYSSNTYQQFVEGNNTIYVRDSNGCMDSVTIFFPLVEVPEIISYDIFQDSCGNPGNQITVTQTISGQPPYQYNVDFSTPFSSQTSFNDFAIGTHTLYVQDANECINRAEFQFDYYELFYILNLDINHTTCTLSNGSVTVVTSQTDMVQYAIDNSPYQTSPYFGGLAPGQHTIYTINRNGCLISRDFTIQPSRLPNPITTQVDNRCNGDALGQINLTAPTFTNPYTYQWSTGDTSNNLTDLPDGTYSVTITDSDNCVNFFSYEIVSPDLLEMDIVGTFFSCADTDSGEIYIDVIGGVGGYSYSIDGGDSFRVDDFFIGVGADEYQVQARDANSCIVETTIQVEQYPGYDNIFLEIANDTCLAATGSVAINNISAGAPPFEYSINGIDYQIAPEIEQLSFGDYTLYIKDINGCIWQENFEVDSLFSLYIAAEVINTICAEDNGQIEIVGSTNFQNLYFLNDSLLGPDSLVTALSPGQYKLLVENEYGCKDSLDVQITEGLLPAPSDTIVHNECYSDTEGLISLTNSDLSTSYSYEWSTGETGSSIVNLATGTYTVTVTDTDNCVSQFSFEILSPPKISIEIGGALFNCPDFDNGEISVSTAGGAGNLKYSINGSAYGSDSIFSGLQSDSYLVSIIDDNLCTQDTLIEILDYENTDEINLVLAMDTCVASNGAVLINNTTQKVGPYRYSIDGSEFYADTSFYNLSYGDYNLFIEDGNGCVWNQNFAIDTIYSLYITATVEDTECNEDNGMVVVTASSDFGNQYFLNSSNRGNETILDSLPADEYNIIVENEYGCQDEVSVTVLPSLEPRIERVRVEYLSCRNNNNIVTLDISSGNPPFLFSLDNQVAQPINVYNNIDPGMHTIRVIDDENCEKELEFLVEDFDPIEISYESVDPSCDQANGNVTFEVTGGAGTLSILYEGEVYPSDEQIDGLYKGLHTFDIVDTTDCSQSVAIDLTMFCSYYIPSIFSPDNDGINDVFEIFFSTDANPIIDQFSLYDRWGELIVNIQDVRPSEEPLLWDGRFKNQDVMAGVYTYFLSGQFDNGEKINSQGTIVLVR